MKIIETQTNPSFKFTDIFPFLPEDTPDEKTAAAGCFSVVHPNTFNKEVGIRINLIRAGNVPYTLEEIDTYIAGLQKAREIAAELDGRTA